MVERYGIGIVEGVKVVYAVGHRARLYWSPNNKALDMHLSE